MKLQSIFTVFFAVALILSGCATSTVAPMATAPSQVQTATSLPVATAVPTTALAATTAPTLAAEAATSVSEIDLGQNSDLGSFLVDVQGMTLYLYTKDSPNTSNCFDQCEKAWPPLLTTGKVAAGEGVDDAMLGTITRKDGSTQVTYNGLPLYYFAKDANPGDVAGQKFGGVWFVVSANGVGIGMDPATPLSGAGNSNGNANDNTNSNTNDNSNGKDDDYSNDNSNGNANSADSAASGAAVVSINNFSFSPALLTVKTGSKVTWTNNGSAAHSVVADQGEFKSATLARGESFSFTFTQPGKYLYYCSFHGGPNGQGMAGEVDVVN
jgi:predicted lipoprotein with Yx(FWY)xxD motif/plastocyanin